MYIIDDTYFQSPKYVIPNLEESDSKAFAELQILIDNTCRLFMQSILTNDEFVDFDSYLVNGMFPIVTTGMPQKWIDLVNGKEDWKGIIQTNGTSKTSLLVDLVYYEWLVENNTYITSFGDTKANPKGADNVNSTQRIVNVWNDFVSKYELYSLNSLINFLEENPLVYTKNDFKRYEIKNQLGL